MFACFLSDTGCSTQRNKNQQLLFKTNKRISLSKQANLQTTLHYRHRQQHLQQIRCFTTNNTSNTTTKVLSHLNEQNQPAMVDITAKRETFRIATAEAIVWLPSDVVDAVLPNNHNNNTNNNNTELYSKKGGVFSTAIVAGTQAVKQTSSLIPFCHPLLVQKCKFDIKLVNINDRKDIYIESSNNNNNSKLVVITCTVSVSGKTGVEMESLTGCTVAALTVYDMLKAASHCIEIKRIRLLSKDGGKSGFQANN